MIASIVWLVVAVVFGVIEAAAPALVCLWFCLGGIFAFVTSFITDNIIIQVVVFVATSLIMLLALRPFMRRRQKADPNDERTNADEYIGRDVIVTQQIPAGVGQLGRVLLADVSWLARTADHTALPTGAHAVVKEVDSTVLVVEPHLTEGDES